MNKLEQALDAILADPLRAARGSGHALAYVGVDVPCELLLATHRIVSHLPWSTDRATPLAEQWLESSFPGWAMSMMQDWATGQFDCFDKVVFSRGEDASQRLYYYICELQRRGQLHGPQPLIFDIARIPRASSIRHTTSAVRRLAQQLGVERHRLADGVERANRRRALFAQVEATRKSHGSLYEKISRASLFADIDDLLADALLSDAQWPAATVAGRVLLAGSTPPDGRLHQAVERTGWCITGEMHAHSLARLGPPVNADATDLAEAIAKQRHAAVGGPRAFGDAAAELLGEVRRTGTDAVLLWLTREDEALAWQLPGLRTQMTAAGIPTLAMTARRWDANDGAAGEINTFLAQLR